MTGHFKDDVLDHLARRANVAQFVSFGPDLVQRHAWIRGRPPGTASARVEEAVAALLAASPEALGQRPQLGAGEPEEPLLPLWLDGPGEILAELRRLAGEGLYTILNETVDVQDGGVSGVAFGDALELAPGDTPRCVEKPDAAGFPRDLGLRVLETVYGFRPALLPKTEPRVEFSLHPLRRGYRGEHTILWEIESRGRRRRRRGSPGPTASAATWGTRPSAC